jgi:hypothetical protein
MAQRRIDVDHHAVPAPYAEWLRTKGIADAGGRALPAWSPEESLRPMDEQGIATAILSVSAPGVHLELGGRRAAEALATARRTNELLARVAQDHPGRLGFFATLTLPDVDGALEEARYAFDTLGADGVAVLPSLLAFAAPGHVLYGSDFPFAPDVAVGYFTSQLDAYDALPRRGARRRRSPKRRGAVPAPRPLSRRTPWRPSTFPFSSWVEAAPA